MISAPFHRFSSVRFLSLEARHDQTLFANLSLKAMVSFFTSHSQSPILLINLMINHFSVWCWRGATSTATEYNSIILWEQAPALAPVWEPSELQAQRLCAQSAIAVRDSRGERQLQIQKSNTRNTTTTYSNTTITTNRAANTETFAYIQRSHSTNPGERQPPMLMIRTNTKCKYNKPENQ